MDYDATQKEVMYAEYAKSYDVDRRIAVGEPLLKERAQFLVSKLVNRSYVLDLGCGTGMVLEHICAKNPQGLTVGIDISAPMLEQAKAKLGASNRVLLVKHDISRGLPFLDNYFDYIVASNVFQEVPDQRALLSETIRILKVQGFFAAMMVCLEDSTPANIAYSRIAEEYCWYFKIFSNMKQMVYESGLKIIVEEQRFAKNPMASLVEKENKMQFSGFNTIMKRIAQEGARPEQVSQGHYKFIAQRSGDTGRGHGRQADQPGLTTWLLLL